MSGNSEPTEKLNDLFVSWAKIGAIIMIVGALVASIAGELVVGAILTSGAWITIAIDSVAAQIARKG